MRDDDKNIENDKREDKLQNIITRYEKLERDFIDYLNEKRESDEAQLVPIVEEHYWQIALEKLRDQERYNLARILYQKVDDRFQEKGIGYKKVYEHVDTGERVVVTYSDIIRYGNRAVWQDFGLVD